MKLNGTKYGKNLKLIGCPFIFKSKNAVLKIGNNCRINSNFFANLIGLYQRTIIVSRKKAVIEIGDNVGMSGTTIYAWDKIQIGDKTIIGANTKIFDTDFHPVDPKARVENDGSKINTKPVIIGKNVFIGCNAIILKGTVIGDNCVIGAGSVVSGKFEENSIIAGNPARVVKKWEVD